MREKNTIDYAQEMLVNAPFGFPISQFYHQPDRQVDAKAIFSQADWRFAPTWTFTLGARYSRDAKTDRGARCMAAGTVSRALTTMAFSPPAHRVSLAFARTMAAT